MSIESCSTINHHQKQRRRRIKKRKKKHKKNLSSFCLPFVFTSLLIRFKNKNRRRTEIKTTDRTKRSSTPPRTNIFPLSFQQNTQPNLEKYKKKLIPHCLLYCYSYRKENRKYRINRCCSYRNQTTHTIQQQQQQHQITTEQIIDESKKKNIYFKFSNRK